MEENRNVLIGVGIIVLILIVIGIAWYTRPKAQVPTEGVATTTAATSTIDIGSTSSTTVTDANGNSYTVTPIYASSTPSATAPNAPSATAPLAFSAAVSADTRASMLSQFADVQSALKTNALDFNAWISLGDLRKAAGDYAGAAADWEYMSALYPANIVSFANLADLYYHYAPDYPKAAAAYVQAIKNNPKQIYLYQDFYQLYADKYPQAAAQVKASLQAGIKANPDSTVLTALLAQMQ